jgi:hypothetical protein
VVDCNVEIQAIDNAYLALQRQATDTAGKLQALAQKLQIAAQAGDQRAREWLLDLREVALAVREEESQVGSLLQAMHDFTANQLQAPPQQPYQQPYQQQPYQQQPYQQQPYPPQQQYNSGGGNPLSGFLNSGFGRAIETGLGFGLGEDLIERIF